MSQKRRRRHRSPLPESAGRALPADPASVTNLRLLADAQHSLADGHAQACRERYSGCLRLDVIYQEGTIQCVRVGLWREEWGVILTPESGPGPPPVADRGYQ